MKKLIIMDRIRSDLVSRTSDEKHKCMGYDNESKNRDLP